MNNYALLYNFFLFLLLIIIFFQIFLLIFKILQWRKLNDYFFDLILIFLMSVLIIYLENISYSAYVMNKDVLSLAWRTHYVHEFIIVGAIVSVSIYSVWSFHNERHYFLNRITSFSIKEAIDDLPAGVCFAYRDGRPVLINRKINILSCTITGNEIDDARLFWENLNKKSGKGIKVLSVKKDSITISITDGVWIFCRKEYESEGISLFQITATDVTKMHRISEDIKKNNIKQEIQRESLKNMYAEMNRVVREEEILSAKIHIHDSIGNNVLATRFFLNQSEFDARQILEDWCKTISLIKRGSGSEAETGMLDQIMEVAKSIGVAICINGELPAQDGVSYAVLSAIRECLANSVRHANADILTVDIVKLQTGYGVEITNNGQIPESPVVERGGLVTLRKLIESNGGGMRIKQNPEFSLSITVPHRENTDE